MELSNEVKAAVAAKVGESILASLEGEARDAILAKAVAELLAGYDLKRLIAEAFHARAVTVIRRLVESGEYDARTEAAARAGLEVVLGRLPLAVSSAFAEMLAGRNGGTYDQRPGAILGSLLRAD